MLSKLYLYIVHSIFLLFYKKEYRKYMNSRNILEIQENKLKEILENNKNSLYGKKYNFNEIKTIEDFQKEVPLTTYEDYLPYIEKIKNGEEHILTYEKVKMFELTSGSTSASKLIPYTDSLKKEFQAGIKVWLYSLYKKYPSLKFGKSYWSITPKIDFQHKEKSLIPIGFEEDSEYFGNLEKHLIDSIFVNPKDIKNEKDMDRFYFKTLSALVAEENIRLFSFWSPSLLLLLIEYLEKNSEKILKTLKEKRKQEVRKYIEAKEYHKIWKNLILISCWGDTNSTEYLKKIREIFPNTIIQEKGLLATEGFISFPDAEKNLSKLSFYSHFFEFLSLDDNKIYNISEIEANKKYELIITTSGGLYRYCIGDIIEVISIENNVPYIKFAGRKGAVSDLFGEKLEESFLKNIMETYKQKIDFYMFAPNKNHYILFIKTDKKINVQDLENKLRENFHYDYCRKLGQLKAIKVFTLTGQPEKEYIQACQNKNQKLGNIKMIALSKESGWENIFNGYFQESEDK